MIINAAKLAGATVSLNTIFNRTLSNYQPIYRQIASVFPSNAQIETYNWLGLVPNMKRWIGEREIHKLTAEKYVIENFDYANGIEVTRDDLADDKLGLLGNRIADLARKGEDAIDAAVSAVFNNAFTATGGLTYDGQYLVDTDHTAAGAGGTSQSNKGTAALASPSLETAYAAMMTLADANGEPMMLRPTHLMVGPALWATARNLVELDTLAAGGANINAGLVKLIVNPRITGNKWFLLDMSQGVAPVIVQIRRPPTFRDPNLGATANGGGSMEFFFRKDFYYGADMTFGVGPGLWQAVWGSDGTT